MNPKKAIRKTCLLFGEGSTEKIFFRFLLKSDKFKSYSINWDFFLDSAFGESCREILLKCVNVVTERNYTVVLCFIDIDKLYSDFPSSAEIEKSELEEIAEREKIEIIWQENNHEDELRKASDNRIRSKGGMKGKLERHSERLLRSSFVKKICKYINDIN